jgi:hypothetical protein
MADTKTMITDIPLDAAVNLNKTKTDIKPWQSYLKQNSPIYGGVISPLNTKTIAMSSKPWVSDKDGNIYVATVTGDTCLITQGSDIVAEVAAKGIDSSVINGAEWDSIKVTPVTGGDTITMAKLVRQTTGEVLIQTISGTNHAVSSGTVYISETGSSTTIHPRAVRLSGDHVFLIAYYDTDEMAAILGVTSIPTYAGQYSILVYSTLGVRQCGTLPMIGRVTTDIIYDAAVIEQITGDYIYQSYTKETDGSYTWGDGLIINSGASISSEESGVLLQWQTTDSAGSGTAKRTLSFVSSTNVHYDLFIKTKHGTDPEHMACCIFTSSTGGFVSVSCVVTDFAAYGYFITNYSFMTQLASSAGVGLPVIRQYPKCVSSKSRYIGGVGGSNHRNLIYNSDVWTTPSNITIAETDDISQMIVSIPISDMSSYNPVVIVNLSSHPLSTPFDGKTVPAGIQQICNHAVGVISHSVYSNSTPVWTNTSSPSDGNIAYSASDLSGQSGAEWRKYPVIWTQSDDKSIDVTKNNDCITTYVMGGNIYRFHTFYDIVSMYGIGCGVALSAYGQIDSDQPPEIGYSTFLYKLDNGNYQLNYVTISPKIRLKIISDNMLQINTISVNNVISLDTKNVYPGSVDYLPVCEITNGYYVLVSESADITIAQMAYGSAVNPNYTSGNNQITLGAVLPAVELRYQSQLLAAKLYASVPALPDYTQAYLSNNLVSPEKTGILPVENYLTAGSTTATYYTPDYSTTTWLNFNGDNTFSVDGIKSDLVYPEITASSIFMSPPIIADYILSTGNDSIFTVGDYLAGTLLTYNNQQILSYNAAGTAYIIPGSNLFRLFGQLYMFDQKNIYLCTESGGSVTGYTKIVNALGLELCGITTKQIYFWSSIDRSFWIFDGSRNLQKLTAANSITDVIAAAYCITDNQQYISTDIGLLVVRDTGMSIYDAYKSVAKIYATTIGPVLETSTGDCVKLTMEPVTDGITQQIDIQTAYMGAGSGMISQNDCLYIRFFDSDPGNGEVTITQNTLTDSGTTSVTSTKKITKQMWDSLTQTYLLRHQPQFQKSAGVSFEIKSDFAIQYLAIGHTDYAKVVTGPAGGN